MPERPPIEARGRVVEVVEPDRLYRVEMENGYRAYAVIERKGPLPPTGLDPIAQPVLLHFSPFDMSRSHLVAWLSAPVTRDL